MHSRQRRSQEFRLCGRVLQLYEVYPHQALPEQRSFVRSRDWPDVPSRRFLAPPSFSPQGIAACLLPYCLRACRLVVLFNTQYRLKYARYVKQRNIAKISVVIGTGVVIGAVVFLYNMRERYARYNCRDRHVHDDEACYSSQKWSPPFQGRNVDVGTLLSSSSSQQTCRIADRYNREICRRQVQ